jgi:hypothetical protein
MKAGDTAKAIAEYKLALERLDADPRIEPANKPTFRKHAEEMLAKLAGK